MKRRHITPFGRNLLRLLAGREQQWLAKKTGLDPGSISGWIVGRSTPKGRNLKKVADALGVGMEDLLADAELYHAEGPLVPKPDRDRSPSPPEKERGAMSERFGRLLTVEMDYLSETEAEHLWNALQEWRGRPPARRAESPPGRKGRAR